MFVASVNENLSPVAVIETGFGIIASLVRSVGGPEGLQDSTVKDVIPTKSSNTELDCIRFITVKIKYLEMPKVI